MPHAGTTVFAGCVLSLCTCCARTCAPPSEDCHVFGTLLLNLHVHIHRSNCTAAALYGCGGQPTLPSFTNGNPDPHPVAMTLTLVLLRTRVRVMAPGRLGCAWRPAKTLLPLKLGLDPTSKLELGLGTLLTRSFRQNLQFCHLAIHSSAEHSSAETTPRRNGCPWSSCRRICEDKAEQSLMCARFPTRRTHRPFWCQNPNIHAYAQTHPCRVLGYTPSITHGWMITSRTSPFRVATRQPLV
eukprot:365910-Chlamydomonas_euryale.AAC.6